MKSIVFVVLMCSSVLAGFSQDYGETWWPTTMNSRNTSFEGGEWFYNSDETRIVQRVDHSIIVIDARTGRCTYAEVLFDPSLNRNVRDVKCSTCTRGLSAVSPSGDEFIVVERSGSVRWHHTRDTAAWKEFSIGENILNELELLNDSVAVIERVQSDDTIVVVMTNSGSVLTLPRSEFQRNVLWSDGRSVVYGRETILYREGSGYLDSIVLPRASMFSQNLSDSLLAFYDSTYTTIVNMHSFSIFDTVAGNVIGIARNGDYIVRQDTSMVRLRTGIPSERLDVEYNVAVLQMNHLKLVNGRYLVIYDMIYDVENPDLVRRSIYRVSAVGPHGSVIQIPYNGGRIEILHADSTTSQLSLLEYELSAVSYNTYDSTAYILTRNMDENENGRVSSLHELKQGVILDQKPGMNRVYASRLSDAQNIDGTIRIPHSTSSYYGTVYGYYTLFLDSVKDVSVRLNDGPNVRIGTVRFSNDGDIMLSYPTYFRVGSCKYNYPDSQDAFKVAFIPGTTRVVSNENIYDYTACELVDSLSFQLVEANEYNGLALMATADSIYLVDLLQSAKVYASIGCDSCHRYRAVLNSTHDGYTMITDSSFVSVRVDGQTKRTDKIHDNVRSEYLGMDHFVYVTPNRIYNYYPHKGMTVTTDLPEEYSDRYNQRPAFDYNGDVMSYCVSTGLPIERSRSLITIDTRTGRILRKYDRPSWLVSKAPLAYLPPYFAMAEGRLIFQMHSGPVGVFPPVTPDIFTGIDEKIAKDKIYSISTISSVIRLPDAVDASQCIVYSAIGEQLGVRAIDSDGSVGVHGFPRGVLLISYPSTMATKTILVMIE